MTRTALLAALLAPTPALACGGFFCNAAQPVDQAGERILFFLDDANAEIEMHVQVAYEGPSEEFSWLLPVPSLPEVLLSTEEIFERIGWATAPTWTMTTEQVGVCTSPPSFGGMADYMVYAPQDYNSHGVSIVGASQLGPYDVTTLTATEVGALTTWLADNGYDLPEAGEAKLGAYVSASSYFVALKLRKDRSAGDLQPIALRFPGTEPIIPLQLTAVAAAPDMTIQPFVFASARAVPENYLHVTINELMVDWTRAGANYPAVVGRAADEAGGQAFATDYAGPIELLPLGFWSDQRYELAAVERATDMSELRPLLTELFPTAGDSAWMFEVGIPITTATVPILARYSDIPDGVEPDDFFRCVTCYGEPSAIAVDGQGLADALRVEWAEPMRRAAEVLMRTSWVTRLSSSMSASEMTVDPRFVMNPDLAPYRVGEAATMQVLCNGVHGANNAPRRLVLPDGSALDLPSSDQASAMGFVWEDWVNPLAGLNALTIEQTGRSGAPVVVSDRRAELASALNEINRGCGCDGTGRSPVAALGIAAALLGRRRR